MCIRRPMEGRDQVSKPAWIRLSSEAAVTKRQSAEETWTDC